jgi:hypothetical protein
LLALHLTCLSSRFHAGADHKTPLEVRESRDGFVVPFLTRQVLCHRPCLVSSPFLPSPLRCSFASEHELGRAIVL